MKRSWKTADFDFELPPDRIARYPLNNRSDSRLLCLNKENGTCTHHQFHQLPQCIHTPDLLVFNNTQVIPARLYAKKHTGGQVTLLIERLIDTHHAMAHTQSNRPCPIGTQLLIGDQLTATIINTHKGLAHVRFNSSTPVLDLLNQYGHMPIPPYFNRPAESIDTQRYQTIYAQHQGAVAAPTAGLHFDAPLFHALHQQQIATDYVTLHIGAGTFQSVRHEDITQHTMHSEYVHVPESTCTHIHQTQQQQGKVIAVGTTVVRSLESASQNGQLLPYQGETDIFIYPGYAFKTVDAMITNFHLPKSTLLMLTCAFGGYDAVMAAYHTAVSEGYRFFSYGDAMLIY